MKRANITCIGFCTTIEEWSMLAENVLKWKNDNNYVTVKCILGNACPLKARKRLAKIFSNFGHGRLIAVIENEFIFLAFSMIHEYFIEMRHACDSMKLSCTTRKLLKAVNYCHSISAWLTTICAKNITINLYLNSRLRACGPCVSQILHNQQKLLHRYSLQL